MKVAIVSREKKILRVRTDAGDVSMHIQEDPPKSEGQNSGLIISFPANLQLIPLAGGRYLLTPLDDEDIQRAAGLIVDEAVNASVRDDALEGDEVFYQ